MDLQKEREAFEKWAFQASEGWASFVKSHGDNYENDKLQFAWKAWQAAKAQAVSEVLKKFCNEHKDPTWRGRLTEYDKGYSDCCIAVLEMIEAQESAND